MPQDGGDAATDVTSVDGTMDVAADRSADTRGDTARDAEQDAAPDTARDTSSDVSTDVPPDVLADVLPDVSDGGAGPETCRWDTGCPGALRYCETPAGMCAEIGECRDKPPPGSACPAVFAPVCGCNGVTYGNDCERVVAGVAKLSDDACGGSS